jgi:lipid A ethanolaminephosphotransferase
MMRSAHVVVAAVEKMPLRGSAYRPRKPVLTVVVAERRRVPQNFSLNGYGVDTNPRPGQLPVISFTDVCGTVTAASLPRPFSKFNRDIHAPTKRALVAPKRSDADHVGLNGSGGTTTRQGVAARLANGRLQTQSTPSSAAGGCTDVFMQEMPRSRKIR